MSDEKPSELSELDRKIAAQAERLEARPDVSAPLSVVKTETVFDARLVVKQTVLDGVPQTVMGQVLDSLGQPDKRGPQAVYAVMIAAARLIAQAGAEHGGVAKPVYDLCRQLLATNDALMRQQQKPAQVRGLTGRRGAA